MTLLLLTIFWSKNGQVFRFWLSLNAAWSYQFLTNFSETGNNAESQQKYVKAASVWVADKLVGHRTILDRMVQGPLLQILVSSRQWVDCDHFSYSLLIVDVTFQVGLWRLVLLSDKLLVLAGVDRLDRDLTVGQMQGAFQMQVLPQAGHAVHEDLPEKVADILATFLVRNKFAQPAGEFVQTFPACWQGTSCPLFCTCYHIELWPSFTIIKLLRIKEFFFQKADSNYKVRKNDSE